jgi:hypothetical protein
MVGVFRKIGNVLNQWRLSDGREARNPTVSLRARAAVATPFDVHRSGSAGLPGPKKLPKTFTNYSIRGDS